MMTANTRASLVACPFCGLEGLTRIGLANHWCAKAPRLSGQQTKGRPLLTEELRKADGGGRETVDGEEPVLTREHFEILDHTMHRAAGGHYCGGGTAMDELVSRGLMQCAGRKSFVVENYYTITGAGREALRKRKEAAAVS